MTQKLYFLIFSPRYKNTIQKEHLHPYVHCNTIHNNENLEAAQVSKDM